MNAVANSLLWLFKVVVTGSTSLLAIFECTHGNADDVVILREKEMRGAY